MTWPLVTLAFLLIAAVAWGIKIGSRGRELACDHAYQLGWDVGGEVGFAEGERVGREAAYRALRADIERASAC